MSKSYYSLGLMSGTSMDGVDASLIKSDGLSKYNTISNKYFEYDKIENKYDIEALKKERKISLRDSNMVP